MEDLWIDGKESFPPKLESRLSDEEFKKLYLCTWEPCHIVEELVSFLRYATPEEVREMRLMGLREYLRKAKRIIEQEDMRRQRL